MLIEKMTKQGDWLFRYRGVLPAFLLIPGLWTFSHFQYLGGSHDVQQVWEWLCFGVSVLGLVLRGTTVGFVDDGSSGRNTIGQRASELNTTGWYSVVRNPLYLGNFLIMLGTILVPADIAFLTVTACLFWIYYERIIATEESFLHGKFGRPYAEWAHCTPVFFPRLKGWQSPPRAFRWRMVLRREYTAVLLIGIAFLVLNIVEHAVAERRLAVDFPRVVMFLISLAVYLILRTLKKHTRILDVKEVRQAELN